MQFIQHDLGNCESGQIVEVTLSAAANVRLMDSSNFQNYKRGKRHNFYGGYAKQSPLRLTIPRNGRWYVAVDLGGYSGRVRSSVRVLPGMLRPISTTPIANVNSLVRNEAELSSSEEDGRVFDVFISHASEDKDAVVRPLANALRSGGLSVWFDEFELRIGDSLRRKIDKGLGSSRFGIVVLSKSFFKKGWTNYELDGLVTRSVSGDQVLLPIWHDISKQEVISYSASLADKLARSTSTNTVQEIAEEIISVINSG